MSLTEIATLGTLAIVGLLALIGIFSTQRRIVKKDDDQTSANLIANLKTTTDLQEKELVSLRTKEVEQGKEIAHLQGQVKVLSDILQGRDPAMLEFFKNSASLIEVTKESNNITKRNSETLTALAKAMTEFVAAQTKKVKGKKA